MKRNDPELSADRPEGLEVWLSGRICAGFRLDPQEEKMMDWRKEEKKEKNKGGGKKSYWKNPNWKTIDLWHNDFLPWQ